MRCRSTTVTLPAFFIGRYEVTVAQYKACVDDGGCTPGYGRAFESDGRLPVGSVSWRQALAYGAWLEAKLTAWTGTPEPIAAALAGRRDGIAWRITLPSEAEWERAARGTDARMYPWGTGIDRPRARYGRRDEDGPALVGTHPAGASPVAAMDMAGNIWEWTRSRSLPYSYNSPYATDYALEGLNVPDSEAQWIERTLRGGAFNDGAFNLRAGPPP